jgi:hypothetical protein
MNSSIWGPPAWFFLHSIAMAYPINPNVNDKRSMLAFFDSLAGILPCLKCKINLQKHMEKIPLSYKILESRETLYEWVNNLHNEVNKSLGKRVFSNKESKDRMIILMKGKKDNKLCYLVMFCIIMVAIIIAVILFKKKYYVYT